MVTGKILIKESHKNLTNVSFHSTIRGIELNNLSLASLTLRWIWNICGSFIKSTIFKSNVVIRSCFTEVIFITRVLRNSSGGGKVTTVKRFLSCYQTWCLILNKVSDGRKVSKVQ